jgi:hypothetical protein
VIASQRVGAKRRPMTGSAKQSILPRKEKLDCFVASAPRTDARTSVRILAACFARVLPTSFRPFKQRAWGMPGARRTRSLVCAWGNKYAHEYSQRVRRDRPASPRNGLRLIAYSPRRSGCLASVACGIIFRKLDASVEASGPHVFAVRFCTVRYRHIHVHRIPPRVRDDREPPLWVGRDGGNQ